MNISLFVHCFPPAKSSLENLVNEMYKTIRQKHNTHIYTGRGSILESYKTFSNYIDTRSDPNTIHRLDVKYWPQLIANRFLSNAIFKFPNLSPWYFGPILNYRDRDLRLISQSDLIIGSGMPTKPFIDAARFARIHNIPLISLPAYHDISYCNNCTAFQNVLDQSQSIICLSKKEYSDISKQYNIDRKKVSILYFSPYTKIEVNNQRKIVREVIKMRLDRIKKGTVTLGFVGQISLRKNIHVLAKLFRDYAERWRDENLNVNLIIAGARTTNSTAIEEMFRADIKKGRVVILYDFENKEEIYQNIDIVVNPSIEENLGMVNLEAIYYGSLLLSHMKSAFAEFMNIDHMFSHASNAFHIITQLVKNPNLYHRTLLDQYDIITRITRDSFDSTLLDVIENISPNKSIV